MRVDVVAKELKFPECCPCCGGRAESEQAFFATRVTSAGSARLRTRSWHFPYCTSCIEHARLWPGPLGSRGVLVGLVTCGAWLLVDAWRRVTAKKEARARCSGACVKAGFAVRFVAWKGNRQVFEIASEEYAVQFALANLKKVTNLSPELRAGIRRAKHERQRSIAAEQEEKQLRALRAGRERQRASAAKQLARDRRALAAERARSREGRSEQEDEVTEPRRVSAAAAAGAEFRHCLAKLESGTSPAARRVALQEGLNALEQRPDDRKRFLTEASRVEVEAALAKAGDLEEMGVRRRVLAAALAELQGDENVDELRAKQIRWLEDALLALDGDGFDARSA